ncbi:binding-protein-dependent transport system inner membrane protein [Natrialba chahannaoensis JCM 10990]|uniref:Binding-protein-dependent transport system inner membrane protein n=1 Tax=Natrialba chahannaoensis JCM 10990 TaxID=1227492 RepID=M0AVU5_9EURY|nr:hypothetical protein [Natrialba chahannaoensis]ELZ02078.1 binding-protein-dependent transport system inner membrane protein [Natrialba chahannaoensis JCM 10990]
MNAFEPTPTASVDEISQWVFGRILVALIFTGYGALLARDLFGVFGTVVALCLWFYGLLFVIRILFRGVDAFLEGRADDSLR